MLPLNEAAPVPNPEVGISDQRRLLAISSDHDRSEGWGLSQAPGNGESKEASSENHPVKRGDGGRNDGATFSKIRKRAFKRAINRASKGPTMYRGKQYTLEELQRQYVGRQDMQPQKQGKQADSEHQGAAAASVSCLTWNCGGLGHARDGWRINPMTLSFCRRLGIGTPWSTPREAGAASVQG